MILSDFEPSNSHMLKRGMVKGRDRRYAIPKRKIKFKRPVERKMKIEGEDLNTKKETNYPEGSKKKILGMTPQNLALTMGIIIVGALLINSFGQKELVGEAVNNGVV